MYGGKREEIMTTQNLAAIDLGTNSCRILIADESGQTLYRDSIATKLGEGLYPEMRFTADAISRGVQALETYAKIMKNYRVSKYRAIATASCRAAQNRDEFLAHVYQKSGLKLEVIDAFEEARLNLKGALLNAPSQAKYAVLYDLGGGSTELTLADVPTARILHTVSIPWGGRNAAEAFQLQEFEPEKQKKLIDEISPYVDAFISDSGLEKYRPETALLATSSTPLRLVSMVNDWGDYKRDKGDGVCVEIQAADKVIQKVYAMSAEERAQSPYIGENRAPIFVSACTIFKTIYDCLGFESFIASFKSAQNGIIEELRTNGKAYEISKNDTWPKDFGCSR